MKKRNRKTLSSKYWLLIFTTICVILVFLSGKVDGGNGPFEKLASYTVAPFQKGINNISTVLRDSIENLDTLQELREENELLKTQVDNLTIENSRLLQNAYELERLQELYKLDANSIEYQKVGARIIAKDAGNWFNTFTIDKGTNHGLAVDMNVIAGTGLVGIITKVGDNWATVRSIIDDASNISAMVLSTGDLCMVQGDLTLIKDGIIKFEQLDNNGSEIIVGEQLVTSYISDKYLQGLTIGVITELNVDSNNLTRSGYITPIVDFNQLQEVLVITNIKNMPDTE